MLAGIFLRRLRSKYIARQTGKPLMVILHQESLPRQVIPHRRRLE